jgi:hypothetical protein
MDSQWSNNGTTVKTSFFNLHRARPDLGHVDRQRLAEAQFPSLVEESHMEMWRIGGPLPPPGEQVIWLGVATWSLYDMELLDVFEAKLSTETLKERIFVFDVDSFDWVDFEKHLPGIGKIFHPPIVGSWNQGVLEEKLSGARAREWLIQRFGLSGYRGTYDWMKPPP